MKANLRKIQKQRSYTEEFKRKVVEDFENGKLSVLQIEKLHNIHNSLIYRWIYKYSTFNEKGYRVVEHEHSSQKKIKELVRQIEQLQSALGRKQIQIDYLEEMIELAKEEYEIDIKKNLNIPHSGGSGKGGEQ